MEDTLYLGISKQTNAIANGINDGGNIAPSKMKLRGCLFIYASSSQIPAVS